MSVVLEVNNLSKYFPTPRGLLHAVDDVSFTVREGRTLGIVGESGCGKSTLGRTIVRLLRPSSGQILFKGRDISSIKGGELKQFTKEGQMIFQDPFSSLNPRMSVFNLIAEPLRIHKTHKSKQDLEDKVFELMDTVGLESRLESSYPHELDGGRRQRIGIARALALNPSFVVCDEPVSALDVSIQAQIINLLEDLQNELGLTLLFITHDMSVVRHISDELLVMYMGKVVEAGDSETIFKERRHPYTRALMSAVPIPNIHVEQKVKILEGEISSPIDPPDACRFAQRCSYAKDICFNKAPELVRSMENHQVACHLVADGSISYEEEF